MGSKVIAVGSLRAFKDYCTAASAKPAVVDFTATWCGPCKMISPIFEQLSGKYGGKMSFLKVDVDENQDIARDAGISAMPTFVFYAKGKEVDRMMGADPSKLEQLVQKYQELQPVFGGGGGRKLSEDKCPADSSGAASSGQQPVLSAEHQADESQPTTSIQIRTSTGGRIIAKFNNSSTVGDLKSHIRSQNPSGPKAFSLVSGVPPKPVTASDGTSLEDAGLLGSVVIQKV